MRTTIIWAPHPDDETLYTAGYVDFCRNRGDRLILVAVTDGAASGARPASWTTSDLVRIRRQEQERAWEFLAGDLGKTIRLGLSDGAVTAAPITALAGALEKIYLSESVEHYVCGHVNSVHPDHKAVAQGVKAAGVRVARGSYQPSEVIDTSTSYTPVDPAACLEAWNSYKAFGHLSVKSEFDQLKANDFTPRITFL